MHFGYLIIIMGFKPCLQNNNLICKHFEKYTYLLIYLHMPSMKSIHSHYISYPKEVHSNNIVLTINLPSVFHPFPTVHSRLGLVKFPTMGSVELFKVGVYLKAFSEAQTVGELTSCVQCHRQDF